MTNLPEIDLVFLKKMIIEKNENLTEFELIKNCFHEDYMEQKIFSNNYSLYKYHFSLFHHLFKLQKIFNEEGFYYLFISPLKIKIFDKNYKNCIYYFDNENIFCGNQVLNNGYYCQNHQKSNFEIESVSLREFYINLDNYNVITEEILEKLISGFWKYNRYKSDLRKYFSALDLPVSATKTDIKKKFKKLAVKHHPDKQGGCPEKFSEINCAYNILMMCL
ncbi:DnaJ domain-containing protein [Candidatus Dependentiae bacterium]|nr:DnaJ domain-containing protein [Candidatus Dependentiae bacterium]